MLSQVEPWEKRNGTPGSHMVMVAVVLAAAALLVPAILSFAFLSWTRRNILGLFDDGATARP